MWFQITTTIVTKMRCLQVYRLFNFLSATSSTSHNLPRTKRLSSSSPPDSIQSQLQCLFARLFAIAGWFGKQRTIEKTNTGRWGRVPDFNGEFDLKLLLALSLYWKYRSSLALSPQNTFSFANNDLDESAVDALLHWRGRIYSSIQFVSVVLSVIVRYCKQWSDH
jgi:hypothetical protein